MIRLSIGVFIAVMFSAAYATPTCTDRDTVVLLVRHAEKLKDAGKDPGLTPAGTARANALVHITSKAGVSAIYTSRYIRTKRTAKPTAESLNLKMNTDLGTDPSALVRDLLANHAGKTVLVSGHSNTVPQIITALGGPTVKIEHDPGRDEYDNLFVLTRRCDGQATMVTLQYGVPSP